ncbi:methyl-accepting chemotaxis protein [Paramagnetospirillum magneticum]|nr:Tar ligand binding domain-containing protein [Paramagnetospirillum magneticum]
MRDNGAITNREVELKDDDMLVSRTDAGGRITFVNKAFIDISGFTEQELLGSPHNLVRHPHMPKEAFADLWASIKAGRPWEGYVKNRTKTGDHYWVRANVTPFMEKGQIAGFISIRSKPTRAQINAAEQAYALFREGKARGLAIRDGRVVSTGLGGRVSALKNSIAGRLSGVLAVLGVLMLVVGWLGISGMRGIGEDMREVYLENTMPAIDLAEVADLSQENYRQIASIAVQMLANQHWVPVSERLAAIESNSQIINRKWEHYAQGSHPAEELALIEKFAKARTAFRDQGLIPAVDLVRKNDAAALSKHFGEAMRPLYNANHVALKGLIDYQSKDAGNTYARAEQHLSSRTFLVIGALVVAVVLGFILAVWILAGIRNPLKAMERHFDAIASGNQAHEIPVADMQEFGQLHSLLRALKAKLGYSALEKAELDRQAEENRRAELNRVAKSLEDRVKGVVDLIDVSSGSLLGNAQTLSANAQQTMVQAGNVTAMTGQVTANVQSVSAATQELSSSVTEISRQVAHAATISGDAVRQAGETDRMVRSLAEAAQKIGEVVNLITDIASQTNLLALNATIEAARAGEAGKGFAVVANEVKHLANQTAKATEEIGQQVTAIQGETRSAVEAIRSISGTIENISELSSAIAAAVEEQGAATAEIARSVEQAAHGTASAAENVEVVSGAAEETKLMSDQVYEAANGLKGASNQLAQEVAGFIREIRSA